MTCEGAVEVNAATGKKKRISKRIRDADFAKTEAPPQPEQAAQPLPGGATSPPLTDTPPLPHAPGAEREQDTAAAERLSLIHISEKFMNVVRKYTSFEELTPTLLREFVEKIVVHECS